MHTPESRKKESFTGSIRMFLIHYEPVFGPRKTLLGGKRKPTRFSRDPVDELVCAPTLACSGWKGLENLIGMVCFWDISRYAPSSISSRYKAALLRIDSCFCPWIKTFTVTYPDVKMSDLKHREGFSFITIRTGLLAIHRLQVCGTCLYFFSFNPRTVSRLRELCDKKWRHELCMAFL